MKRFFAALLALITIVTITPAVRACDMDVGIGCDRSIDVKGLIQMASCDMGDPTCVHHPEDLKGLIQLACDGDVGIGCNYAPELDKLEQLACDDMGYGCYKKDLLNGLMQLACEDTGVDCYKSDLPAGDQIASLPKDQRPKFMGIPKSINKDSMAKKFESKGVDPSSFSASVGNIKQRADKKVTSEQEAVARIKNADPKDFPILLGFLNKKIPVNAQDTYGNTLLFYMASKGDMKAVKYLLDQGADPKIKNTKGYTAADFAKAKGHKDVEKLLQLANKEDDGHLGSDTVPVGSPSDR